MRSEPNRHFLIDLRRTLRYRQRPHSALGLLFALVSLCRTGSAEAIVVHGNEGTTLWPTDDDGYTRVNLCYDEESDVNWRKSGSGRGLVHAPNPSNSEVMEHIRSALTQSWEVNTSIRFGDFGPCRDGTNYGKTIKIQLHRDRPAASQLGYLCRPVVSITGTDTTICDRRFAVFL